MNPDLVARAAAGQIYSVRYDAVNAMLLNEFLKEHRKVEQQKTTITQLKKDFQAKLPEKQKQIKTLASGLEKVNNQLELSKAAPRASTISKLRAQRFLVRCDDVTPQKVRSCERSAITPAINDTNG